MAMTDWQAQKGHKQITTTTYKPTTQQKKANVPENFPEFETINRDFGTLLEGVIKHIVANSGSKLTYLNSKDVFDLHSGMEWHNFVVEFMSKSQQICEYFNIPNHFKHIRNGDFDIITYES
jgi:hypothetical protein